ncbi:pore-forming CpnT exporter EsxE [Nocardioides koreensis]|uniref:Pore-forming CpnT exporter EsxE n=1 Tax=Nocardioides koreensis TaxID=433651 RepID=A0ABN2ZJX6_9ACTN
MSAPFAVDLEELARVVGEMATCQGQLLEVADEISRQVRALHDSWQGEAAVAHEVAQRAWDAGFGDTREALAAMRTAADVAHHHYEAAALTNVGMWEQLR